MSERSAETDVTVGVLREALTAAGATVLLNGFADYDDADIVTARYMSGSLLLLVNPTGQDGREETP